MVRTRTEQRLQEINDEGLFEQIAMAVLRDAEPIYRTLTHPGINAQGRTIKSPVDGIGFVHGAETSRMIAVHHTTTAASGLKQKWLHDPSTVKTRGKKRTAPAGDVLKVLELIEIERKTQPDMLVTVVLTTNQEPDQDLIRQVHAKASQNQVNVDFWTRSRLAHFLDNDPQGQWLRRQFLGDEPARISLALLSHLTAKSLQEFPLHGPATSIIDRELDQKLSEVQRLGCIFLAAESGFGKSTACFKALNAHAEAGGMGFVLAASAVANAITFDGALEAILRELHPFLSSGCGSEAIALCDANQPLLLVIEDINVSGQAAALAERIASWDRAASSEKELAKRPYRILCPIWPEVMNSLHQAAQRTISEHAIFAGPFTPTEGQHAVLRRAKLAGFELSEMEAEKIAASLGCDPLLIALHDPRSRRASISVIDQFVEGALNRIASQGSFPASRYRVALRRLGSEALLRRKLDPEWLEIERWENLNDDDRRALWEILQNGELIRLSGNSEKQRIAYRHDRVREWLLVDAVVDLAQASSLPESISSEPYYAEIIGGALAKLPESEGLLVELRTENPLALFIALRWLAPKNRGYVEIVGQIDAWLDDTGVMAPSYSYLRWEAASILGDVEAPDIARLIKKMRAFGWEGWRALLRNGDLTGGIQLCYLIGPSSGAPWRDVQLDHVKQRFGPALLKKIDELLRLPSLDDQSRIGLLRIAGYMASNELAAAIEVCWLNDKGRENNLRDYVWAFAQCCGSDAEVNLKKVADAWAALPADREENGMPSPRESLAANELRLAFRQRVPRLAIPYFVHRAEHDEDLRWPITYMLSEIDEPTSITFIVRELAKVSEMAEKTGGFSPFAFSLQMFWRRRQENGESMSEETREVLKHIWCNSEADKFARRHAFRLWTSNHCKDDIEVLKQPNLPKFLDDEVLHARLKRGDQTAVPYLLERLKESDPKSGWWWHSVKHVWTPALMPILDKELELRSNSITDSGAAETDTDYAISDLLMRLPTKDAERLLLKHWGSLCNLSHYFQTAIYLATPTSLGLVQKVIESGSDLRPLFQFIELRIGLKTADHPGISRPEQVEAIGPYLSFLQPYAAIELWELCNERGWFDLRKRTLDPYLSKTSAVPYQDEQKNFAALDEMVERNQFHWVRDWIKRYEETGVSKPIMIKCIKNWLETRRTIDALKMTAEILKLIGLRTDLHLLRVDLQQQAELQESIVQDTTFAVYRRTLV